MVRALYRYFLALSVNPRDITKAIRRVPWFLNQRAKFNELSVGSGWRISSYPILLDRDAQSAFLGEYFWQDLFLAKEIIKLNPRRHVDVGSRVDGFVAHLACVRRTEVFDIRPLTPKIENVVFTQWDMTAPKKELRGVADCVSCLHTLEHIGLGRYGDTLDPDGWKKGLESLIGLLAPGGVLWLSVPIGIERVEFNAHRVFDPATIISYAAKLGVTLGQLWYLTDSGIVKSEKMTSDIISLSKERYGLGVFLFCKDNDASFK